MDSESQNITMLNAFNANTKDCIIKVKLLRVWRRKSTPGDKTVNPIDMILMDEQGTKISGICFQRSIKRFEKWIVQDNCIMIKKPAAIENHINFRIIEHDYKVSLAMNTSVFKCNNWNGPKYGFNFVDFSSILGKANDADKNTKIGAIIDVIGYVMICYDLEDVMTKNGPGKRLNLKLQDLSDEIITVTLWDDYATDMFTYMSKQDKDMHVVLIIQFASVKVHEDKRSISNTYQATRLFINSDIDEIHSFKSSYIAKTSSSSGSLMMKSAEDIFLKDIDYVPIAKVNLIEEEDQNVVIVGTIKGISNNNKGWYYQACNVCASKCKRKMITIEKVDGTCDLSNEYVFECLNPECTAKNISRVYRFKIPIIVEDESGSVRLTMFNRDACKLLKKSAADILSRQEKATDFEDYPIEFDAFIGKKFGFVITIAEFNISNNVEFYAINNITNDQSILSQLYKNHGGIQEFVLSNNEDDTPTSTADVSNDKGKALAVKRNLEIIYDANETSETSTSKKHSGDKDSTNEVNLLVPKKEK